MTRDRVKQLAQYLWDECSAELKVTDERTIHNAVIRCAFAQAVHNSFNVYNRDGIVTIIAGIIKRNHATVCGYVGITDKYSNVANHPATKQLSQKLSVRLKKLNKEIDIPVEIVNGRWYVSGKLYTKEMVKKAILFYEGNNDTLDL